MASSSNSSVVVLADYTARKKDPINMMVGRDWCWENDQVVQRERNRDWKQKISLSIVPHYVDVVLGMDSNLALLEKQAVSSLRVMKTK